MKNVQKLLCALALGLMTASSVTAMKDNLDLSPIEDNDATAINEYEEDIKRSERSDYFNYLKENQHLVKSMLKPQAPAPLWSKITAGIIGFLALGTLDPFSVYLDTFFKGPDDITKYSRLTGFVVSIPLGSILFAAVCLGWHAAPEFFKNAVRSLCKKLGLTMNHLTVGTLASLVVLVCLYKANVL